MLLVWIVRVIWLAALLYWMVCVVNFLRARRAYRDARARILPELEKLKQQVR
jgi:hypothetical protein